MQLLNTIHGMPLRFKLSHIDNLLGMNKFLHKLSFIVACQQFIDNIVPILPIADFGDGDVLFEFALGSSIYDSAVECQINMYKVLEACISSQISIQQDFPIPSSQNLEACQLDYIMSILQERMAFYKMKRLQLTN